MEDKDFRTEKRLDLDKTPSPRERYGKHATYNDIIKWFHYKNHYIFGIGPCNWYSDLKFNMKQFQIDEMYTNISVE